MECDKEGQYLLPFDEVDEMTKWIANAKQRASVDIKMAQEVFYDPGTHLSIGAM